MDAMSVIERAPGTLSTPVQSDLVFLNPGRDNYVAIDAVGRAIWETLTEPMTIRAVVAQLQQDFDAEPDVIQTDLIAFVDQMQQEGLIRVASAAMDD
jgi:hypothetical protein